MTAFFEISWLVWAARWTAFVREDHFVITVASEIMAILCLANDMKDLKERLGKIIVAYNMDGDPVTAADLRGRLHGSSSEGCLKAQYDPDTEHTPALVHGGPFANIAHGRNSVQATKMALKNGRYRHHGGWIRRRSGRREVL